MNMIEVKERKETLFKCAVFKRWSTNWGHWNQEINENQLSGLKCLFLRRVRNQYEGIWRKTSRSTVENQQTQPTYDTESGNWSQATLVGSESSHRTSSAPLVSTPFWLPTFPGWKFVSYLNENLNASCMNFPEVYPKTHISCWATLILLIKSLTGNIFFPWLPFHPLYILWCNREKKNFVLSWPRQAELKGT